MDPMTMYAIAQAAGAAISALANKSQKRQPYSGGVSADQSLNRVNDLASSLFGRLANQGPVRLRSSFAQTPPGLTGVDPATLDPSLLELPHQWDTQGTGGSDLAAIATTNYLGDRTRPPTTDPIGYAIPRTVGGGNPNRLPYTPIGSTTPVMGSGGGRQLDPQTRAAVDLVLKYNSRSNPMAG